MERWLWGQQGNATKGSRPWDQPLTCPHWEGDGEELLKCPAGAGRAARSVRARGEQAAGHFSDTMGQMSVSSQWPARSSVPLNSSA